ncbi:MAG: hypothetical protein ABEK84_02970 [Salinibacter sp.]
MNRLYVLDWFRPETIETAVARLVVATLVAGGLFALRGSIARAQHRHGPTDTVQTNRSPDQKTPLRAPGHSIFGAVQEVIRELESRPDTDWSDVNLERLRQHLLDMHRVAQKVAVEAATPIDGGVRLTVRPTTSAARASLRRVLSAHPAMLKAEAGWSMETTATDDGVIITTTDPEGQDAAKIRALGYIGLLSYGAHHQRHHWMIVRGEHPHSAEPPSAQ